MNTEDIEIDITKNRILKVALELFANFGFDAVSTRKIAQIAKCNIASLNYHFGTKKQLYHECLLVMEPKKDYQLKELLQNPLNKDDFEKTFLQFCIVVAEFVVENASALKLLINEINAESNLPIKDSFLKPLTDIFEKYVKEAQKKSIVSSKIETTLFTKMVVSVILSQKLYKSFQTFENISNEELARKIVESSTTGFYVE